MRERIAPAGLLLHFGADLEVVNRRRWTADELLARYGAAPKDSTLGLAYVWDLFITQAASEIREARPDARIIIGLREPTAALHALHSEFVYDGKPHANPNERARSRVVRRFLAAPPLRLRRALRNALPGPMRRAAYRRAVTLNAVTPERAALPDELRNRLRAEFASEVDKLERLLGRSLADWRATS